MSASSDKLEKDVLLRIAFRYLLITILCAVFGAAYELFSHGVYAYGILYAFAFPLLGGLLPAMLFVRLGKQAPSPPTSLLWHFGVSALTVGSLFSGALTIYGTDSRLTVVYWLSGGACLALALLGSVYSHTYPDKGMNITPGASK